MQVHIKSTLLRLVMGDITAQKIEAIVNAANTGLRGGSGVDGAIHRRGGAIIAKECRRIREQQGGCPVGEAVITSGGLLPSHYVIHTVGPIWQGGQKDEDGLLAKAYFSSLQLAREKGIKSVAFPSISTGAYGFPLQRAARTALATVMDYLQASPNIFAEIRFVLFSQEIMNVYEQTLQEFTKKILI